MDSNDKIYDKSHKGIVIKDGIIIEMSCQFKLFCPAAKPKNEEVVLKYHTHPGLLSEGITPSIADFSGTVSNFEYSQKPLPGMILGPNRKARIYILKGVPPIEQWKKPYCYPKEEEIAWYFHIIEIEFSREGAISRWEELAGKAGSPLEDGEKQTQGLARGNGPPAETSYRRALLSVVAARLGIAQEKVSVESNLQGRNDLFENPKQLIIRLKGINQELARLNYVVLERDPSRKREKTIDAYGFTEDSDLLSLMIAYVAFVHEAKKLHVSEATEAQEKALDKIVKSGFGTGGAWGAYKHYDFEFKLGALRLLLFPLSPDISADPMPAEVELSVAVRAGEDKVCLIKQTRDDLQWPNFAYDVYWQGNRVIPLTARRFKSKEKGYVFPNIVGDVDPYDLVLNIDAIDLGETTGQGLGFAIVNFLKEVAAKLNVKLRVKSTANPGLMRMWQRVTDFTFSDSWVKAALKNQLEEDLNRKPALDSDHARPTEEHTSFYFSPSPTDQGKFVLDPNGRTYDFSPEDFSGPLYVVDLVLVRGEEIIKVNSLKYRESNKIEIWSPVSLMPPVTCLEDFNFHQDGTVELRGKFVGRLIAFSDQMDIIGCPVVADSSISSVDEFSRSLRRKFKLIVTDMDDSLIKSAGKIHSVEADHKLSPRSRVLISLLREKRVGFAVITGARLESALYRYADELSPEDRAGQYVYVCGGGEGYRFNRQGSLDARAERGYVYRGLVPYAQVSSAMDAAPSRFVKIKPLQVRYSRAQNLLTYGNFRDSEEIFESILNELKGAERDGKLCRTGTSLKHRVENCLLEIEADKEREGIKQKVRNTRFRKEREKKGNSNGKERIDVRNPHKHLKEDSLGGSSPLGGNGAGKTAAVFDSKTIVKFSSSQLTVDIDFDQTASTKDTVLCWARMIQGEVGYCIDEYLRRKNAYAELKNKINLAEEFVFFAGRPENDLIALARIVELNPKFLDTIKLIKVVFGIASLKVNIVSAGLKNIIEAFFNRGDIRKILQEEGIEIGTIKANELMVKDEKFIDEFKEEIITGPEKADFIAPDALYAGDNSDEKNLSGRLKFFVNIYWPQDKIEGVIREYKEKITPLTFSGNSPLNGGMAGGIGKSGDTMR